MVLELNEETWNMFKSIIIFIEKVCSSETRRHILMCMSYIKSHTPRYSNPFRNQPAATSSRVKRNGIIIKSKAIWATSNDSKDYGYPLRTRILASNTPRFITWAMQQKNSDTG